MSKPAAGKAGLVVVYRVSSGGYSKVKPDYIQKIACLRNLLTRAHEIIPDVYLAVIADNCTDELFDQVVKTLVEFEYDPDGPDCEVHRTSFGNGAASFRYGLDLVVTSPVLQSFQPVYMVEDDYLHQPHALEVIVDGLQFGAFSTGYDHPDKYGYSFHPETSAKQPLGGSNEQSTVLFHSQWSHYKQTPSTTMTFCATVGTLNSAAIAIAPFVSSTHPHDHYMFLHLGESLGLKLVSAVPGVCTHGETAFMSTVPRRFVGAIAPRPWKAIAELSMLPWVPQTSQQSDAAAFKLALKSAIKDELKEVA